LKTIPASAEIQHSADAFLSGITMSEARFSIFTLRGACLKSYNPDGFMAL